VQNIDMRMLNKLFKSFSTKSTLPKIEFLHKYGIIYSKYIQ